MRKNIQLIDFGINNSELKGLYTDAIDNCLIKGDFIQGDLVRQFESELSIYLSTQYAHSCGNGTDALWLAFKAIGLCEGDTIALPAFSYIAAAEVATLLKLNIVWYPINPYSYNIDEQFYDFYEKNPTIKAVVFVHLFGQGGNISPFIDFCKQKNIYTIEDNAQSLGAVCKDNHSMLGTLADIGTTSFFPTKNLGCFGDGGAIFTNNKDFYDSIKKLSNHGQSQKYVHESLGINSRLDTIQAAILSINLRFLDKRILSKQNIAAHYDELLVNNKNVLTPTKSPYTSHTYHQYCIQVEHSRDELRGYLDEQQIPTAIHYPSLVYEQLAYKNATPKIRLIDNELLCKKILCLPIHPYLEEEQITYIAEKINYFYGRNA